MHSLSLDDLRTITELLGTVLLVFNIFVVLLLRKEIAEFKVYIFKHFVTKEFLTELKMFERRTFKRQPGVAADT